MFNSFYRSKYFAILALCSLFVLNFLASYPGGMTSDSVDQFAQSLTFNFVSYHPSLMAMLWSLFNYIYPGPQTMLFFHLAMFWTGVGFLYFADNSNKYRWMYLLLPFLPNVLSQSSYIWKDIGFSMSFFLVASVSIYFLYRNKIAPFAATITFILILPFVFYSISVKFQAQFIIWIILFFMLASLYKTRVIINVIGTVFFSVLLLTANFIVTNKLSINGHGEQVRQFFDIAAIAQEINDDSAMPKYVKEYPGYNFETLKKNFTHKWIGPLVYPEDKVYVNTLDPQKLADLQSTFMKLVLNHPFIYLKHRIINFADMLYNVTADKNFAKGADLDRLAEIVNTPELNTIKIHHFQNGHLRQFFVKFFSLFPKPLKSNAISFGFLCFLTIYLMRRFTIENTEFKILTFVVVASLAFTVTLFFTIMADDYRYYYLVRILTFMTLPIFLKFWNQPKNKSLTPNP